MTSLTLPARPPFSFRSVVFSHGWAQLAPFAFDEASSTLIYVDRLASGRVLEYRVTGSPAGVTVRVEGELNKAEKAEISEKITWMFGLDMDFSEFYAWARREPKLAQVKKKAQGRVLRSPTLFEDVLRTILTTNTLWAATKRMTANLVAQFGDPLSNLDRSPGRGDGADEVRHAFPTPERLARVPEAVLRAETRLGYRAPYIPDLARRVASREINLEIFKYSDLPTHELRKELMKMKGIGPYASANLLMLLGRYDFLTIDTWALKMVSHEWHGGNPVTPADVESPFEQWGKWKGLAYWFWDWSYKG
jgi:3-methyladenine DNA glycosylase/8-oxoguanine DNA glycosylase